jgi:hypothetical protein
MSGEWNLAAARHMRRLADGTDSWSAQSVREILDALIEALEARDNWKRQAEMDAAEALEMDWRCTESCERAEHARFMAAGWRRLAKLVVYGERALSVAWGDVAVRESKRADWAEEQLRLAMETGSAECEEWRFAAHFWMNKADSLRAELARLRETAVYYSVLGGHAEECSAMSGNARLMALSPCSCGLDALRAALGGG